MSTDAITPDTTPNDRDNWGRFQQGNQLGRGNAGGNPSAKKMALYKKALIACGSEEDIQKLYAALLAAALTGDTPAAKLLLDHLVGRPAQALEISGTEGEPVKFNMTAFAAIITTALADHPEAQYKLAAALKGAKLNGPDGPG